MKQSVVYSMAGILLVGYISVFSIDYRPKKQAVVYETGEHTWLSNLKEQAEFSDYKDLVDHYYDSLFTHLHKKGRLNGTVLVGEKGKILYKGAFGYADYKTKAPLKTEQPFQLASVSKMFTATAIMLLQEEGKLDYEADIRTYIPQLPYEGVTVRHLLNHRSGLPRYMSVAHDKWNWEELPLSNNDMVNLLVKQSPPPYFSPGNGFNYLNTNYALLAVIVERISGKKFEEFVKQRIFWPLDMNNSFVYANNGVDPMPQTVKGHERRWRGYRAMQDDYLNGVTGDKGVYASVEDLFKFNNALYTDKLLKQETINEAYKPGSNRLKRGREDYGFGWRLRPGKQKIVYHFGWWKGFRTCFIRDLDNERTIIVLNNRTVSPSYKPFFKELQTWDDKFERIDFSPESPMPTYLSASFD